VFFTFSAIPLIVTRKSLILAEILNTFIQTHSISYSIRIIASFDIVGLNTGEFGLICQIYTKIKNQFPCMQQLIIKVTKRQFFCTIQTVPIFVNSGSYIAGIIIGIVFFVAKFTIYFGTHASLLVGRIIFYLEI